MTHRQKREAGRRRSLNATRRDFLKASAASAAAFSMAPGLFLPRLPAAPEEWESPHPHVDGRRVVGIHDPAMTTEESPRAPWLTQEKLVDAARVAENMDRLACALAEEKSEETAWKKIFVKPAGKSWTDVVVAIKTNNIAVQHTRSAVMAKFCNVLAGVIGVKPENILIYDACHGGDMDRKTPFAGLPEGCRTLGKWDGSTLDTAVPAPWHDGSQKAACVPALVKDEVDILLNIALCKGHHDRYGRFTMAMKNHLGTFFAKHAHKDQGTEYVLAINKTPEILGKMSAKGKVLFPRQQLCFIDALWASEDGPGCESEAQPNRFFMGTSAPVLDYVVAHDFRKGTMGWSIDEEVTERFLTEFGLAKGDLLNEGKIVEAAAAG